MELEVWQQEQESQSIKPEVMKQLFDMFCFLLDIHRSSMASSTSSSPAIQTSRISWFYTWVSDSEFVGLLDILKFCPHLEKGEIHS
ncbi:unnamed protein product [Victoria cruziana]